MTSAHIYLEQDDLLLYLLHDARCTGSSPLQSFAPCNEILRMVQPQNALNFLVNSIIMQKFASPAIVDACSQGSFKLLAELLQARKGERIGMPSKDFLDLKKRLASPVSEKRATSRNVEDDIDLKALDLNVPDKTGRTPLQVKASS